MITYIEKRLIYYMFWKCVLIRGGFVVICFVFWKRVLFALVSLNGLVSLACLCSRFSCVRVESFSPIKTARLKTHLLQLGKRYNTGTKIGVQAEFFVPGGLVVFVCKGFKKCIPQKNLKRPNFSRAAVSMGGIAFVRPNFSFPTVSLSVDILGAII